MQSCRLPVSDQETPLPDSDGDQYLASLERMVNQIADNLAADPEQGAAALADHLKRFWDPTMRRDLVASVSAGTINPSKLVHNALLELTEDD